MKRILLALFLAGLLLMASDSEAAPQLGQNTVADFVNAEEGQSAWFRPARAWHQTCSGSRSLFVQVRTTCSV